MMESSQATPGVCLNHHCGTWQTHGETSHISLSWVTMPISERQGCTERCCLTGKRDHHQSTTMLSEQETSGRIQGHIRGKRRWQPERRQARNSTFR